MFSPATFFDILIHSCKNILRIFGKKTASKTCSRLCINPPPKKAASQVTAHYCAKYSSLGGLGATPRPQPQRWRGGGPRERSLGGGWGRATRVMTLGNKVGNRVGQQKPGIRKPNENIQNSKHVCGCVFQIYMFVNAGLNFKTHG